jgi:hypothetical protein
MKCINTNCGLDALENNKLCHDCNEISTLVGLQSKLKSEHQHESNDWKKCKECCKMNILLRSKVCDNCGDDRHYHHRLCHHCIHNVLPCEICNGINRTAEKYLRSCIECMTKNIYCAYVNCINEPLKGSIVCQMHCCKNDGCLNVISGQYNNKNYCDNCVCRCCDQRKVNDMYCLDHTCKYEGCHEYIHTYRHIYEFCNAHICSFYNCENGVIQNGKYCLDHTCCIKNCLDGIKTGFVHSFKPNAGYCKNHSCDANNCLEIKYMNRSHCASHLCSVEGCDQNSYGYTCHKHTITRVKCWHTKGNYKKCNIMEISRLITMGHKFDKKLLWKQLYKSNNNFYIGFQPLGYSLLYVLKLNGVCKDIREIIFFEYLVTTIQYYFNKKCSDCVMICSKEKCGMIGLPYDPGCKTHVCSKDGCSKLKYKTLNVCIGHKCKHCTKEIHNKTEFCRKHLCPICNVRCIADGYNFCRMCRCKQRITNSYGTVRCENPVYNEKNNIFCLEHKE